MLEKVAKLPLIIFLGTLAIVGVALYVISLDVEKQVPNETQGIIQVEDKDYTIRTSEADVVSNNPLPQPLTKTNIILKTDNKDLYTQLKSKQPVTVVDKKTGTKVGYEYLFSVVLINGLDPQGNDIKAEYNTTDQVKTPRLLIETKDLLFVYQLQR